MVRKIVKLLSVPLLLAIFCVVFWASWNVAFAEEKNSKIVLLPIKDSYIQHDYPYWDPFFHPSCHNYGGSTALATATTHQSNHPRILIQFDLSSLPKNAVVNSAYLKLYCSFAGVWKSIGCYPLTHSWIEGTMRQTYDPPWQIADGVTWNTYDGINSWTAPGGDYSPYLLDKVWIPDREAVGWKTWDVTPAVSDWVSGALPNHGLIIITLGAGNYYTSNFYSKEYFDPTFWPQLEISYVMPDPPEEHLIENLSVAPQVLSPYIKDSQVEISYELGEDSSVKIEICDKEGNKVKSLFEDLIGGKEIEIEEDQEEGIHTEPWCGVIDFEEISIVSGDKGVLLAPDGEYTVKVTATSKSTGTVDSAEAVVTIKSE